MLSRELILPRRFLRPITYDAAAAPRARPAIKTTRVPSFEFDTSVNFAAHDSHNQKNSIPRSDFEKELSAVTDRFGESKRNSLPVRRLRKVAEQPGLEHFASMDSV